MYSVNLNTSVMRPLCLVESHICQTLLQCKSTLCLPHSHSVTSNQLFFHTEREYTLFHYLCFTDRDACYNYVCCGCFVGGNLFCRGDFVVFLHYLNNHLVVTDWYSYHHSDNGPFKDWTNVNELNTGLFRNSEPPFY